MPNFSEEIDFIVSVDEFLSNCSPKDIKELIQALEEDNHINQYNGKVLSFMEDKYLNHCNHLKNSYLQISQEDYEVIENLSKKYGGY